MDLRAFGISGKNTKYIDKRHPVGDLLFSCNVYTVLDGAFARGLKNTRLYIFGGNRRSSAPVPLNYGILYGVG